MRHLRLLMGLTALMLVTITAQAAKGDTFTLNNLTYTVTSENATAGTGTVSVKPGSSSLSGVIDIPEKVENKNINYTVTQVASFLNTKVEEINISSTVTSIAAGILNVATLKAINVDENNTKFASIDGVLYNKAITQIVCFPPLNEQKTYYSPETITQINKYAFQNTYVEKVYLNEGLVKIGDYGFQSCHNLTYIDIPTTLQEIGAFAFQSNKRTEAYDVNIHDLTNFCHMTVGRQCSLWLSDGSNKEDNFFINGQKIVDLIIPSNITTINQYIFYGCRAFKSVTFEGNMELIGQNAFDGCQLNRIQFNGTCNNIGLRSFARNHLTHDLYIPKGLFSIASRAFLYEDSRTYDSNQITQALNEGSVDRINVYIPEDVEIIESGAFHYLPINELHIEGKNLKEIRSEAFRAIGPFGKCISLWIDDLDSWMNVNFVTSWNIKQYGESGHPNYPNNTCGEFPMGGVEKRDNWGANVSWNKNVALPRIFSFSDLYVNNTLLTNLVIPEGITKIKRGTFAGCQSITNVTIPSTVDSIEEFAFYQCPNVRVLKIPNSVKFIGISAFDENWAMTHITMPSWATAIGPNVVKNLNTDKLTEFTIPAYVKDFHGAKDLFYTPFTELSLYYMGDSIPDNFEDNLRVNSHDNSKQVIWGSNVGQSIAGWDTGIWNLYQNYPHYDLQKLYVKKSVYNNRYPDGLWRGHAVSYKVPVSMTNASGNPIEYKTLCRDFDVDLTHTNDNLPEGVEPLRAYLVEDVDGDLRMVFLNEIKYIPSRLKANTTDSEGNRYQGVDEYVGVVLRGTPGYTYYYEIGEHDYTQGAEGQWLMDDAMAYSNATYDGNLMAGDANDDFYVHMTVENENNDEIINYGLNAGKFKIYHKDGWLTYNKSYLQLPKYVSDAIEGDTDAEGNANLTFVFSNADGSTDKVSSIEFNQNCESDIFYNPYGQRVNANTKGIVINSGKKRVNK